MATAHMRYKQGIQRESNVLFDVPPEDHPLHDVKCPECSVTLGTPVGEIKGVRLRVDQDELGRLDPEKSYKWKSGQWIEAVAQVIHDDCAVSSPSYLIGRTVSVKRDDV